MIDQIVISGTWLWVILGFFILEGLTQLSRVLNPNSYIKKIVSGEYKLRDNLTRFCGMLCFTFIVLVILYILGYIS